MSSFLRRYSGPLLLFAGGAILIAVTPFFIPDRSDTAPVLPPPPEAAKYYSAQHTMPGARQPRAVSAAAAGLTEADEVIGVVVRGHARAYLVRVMAGRQEHHVVNDLINGVPVTVTYNNVGRLARAFTGTGSEPLDVWVGATPGGEMILEVGGRQYHQRSGDALDPTGPGRLPLETMPVELTYWKTWHTAHPDTDVVASIPAAEHGPTTSPRP